MARVVMVRAIKGGFQYAGRDVHRGDWIPMTPLDAAGAHRHGLVSLTRGPVGIPRNGSADEIPPPAPSAPRRRYRRRDLESER